MGIYKKMSKAGGITIPSALRRDLGIQPGDAFELKVDYSNGNITIERYKTRCIFCKTDENVNKIIGGKGICEECVKKANEKESSEK